MRKKKVLLPTAEIKTGPYANIALLPVSLGARTWGFFSFFSLWVKMSTAIPTFILGTSMILAGLDILSSFIIAILGTFIMGILIVFNSSAGTKFGIPFPVQARAAFGIRGSQIPSILRAIIAAGWYGIELWIGTSALDALTALFYPNWVNLPNHIVSWFVVFLIVNLILITYFKPGKPNKMIDLVNHASTIMLIAGAIIWCFLLISRGGKFSLMYGPPSTFQNPDWALVGAMLLTITFYWSTAGLNASDYTRYAKSQSKQSVGQLVGIMVGQTLYIGIGIIIASLGLSANMSIWNPVEISTDFGRIFVSFILISIIITTLKTNVIADQESVNLNLMNLYPRKINWFRAAIISTSIAILMQPWILLENWQSYCNTWILNYSIILAPIIGILTIDYLRRKSNYSIMDLYTANGIYWYSKGFNWNALLALAIGVGIGLTQNYTFGPYSIFPYGPVVSLMVSIGLFLLFSKVSTILAKK